MDAPNTTTATLRPAIVRLARRSPTLNWGFEESARTSLAMRDKTEVDPIGPGGEAAKRLICTTTQSGRWAGGSASASRLAFLR